MTRIHAVGAHRLGGVALLALLLLGAVGLSGCFVITDVSAPSGPASAEYVVTLQMEVADLGLEPSGAELSGLEESRGVLAVQFPAEWQLLSADYEGAASGELTFSPVITDYYAELAQIIAAEQQPAIPGITLRPKAGYQWWAGYSAAHPDATTGALTVRLVFDQNSATGASQLDFLTGAADAIAPEDPDALGSAWDLGGMALDQPVFTGVAPQDISPQPFYAEDRDFYVALGEPLAAQGALFDPDTPGVTASVDFGDGQGAALDLLPLGFALGVWDWEWQHAWQERGTYEVTARGDDGNSVGQATATVHVGQSPFTDLPDGHRFFGAILDLWRTGVIQGYADGSFRPDEPVLRAQLAKMVVLAFGYHDEELTNPDMPTFKDVLPGPDPYPYDYVEEAASYHLMTGFADDTFRPWDRLSRVQLVRVMVRSDLLFLSEPPADYQMPFTDVDAADRRYLALAHYNGLVQGKDATHFDPYGSASRGHFAQIMYNAQHVELPAEIGEAVYQAAAAAREDSGDAQAGRAARLAAARILGMPAWMALR